MNIYLLNGVCSGEQNDRLTYYSVKRGGTFGGYMQDFDEYLKLKNRERNLLLVIPQDEIMVSWFKGNGFVEFEDYMTEEYFKKEIVVIYGNCHAESIRGILSRYRPFTEQYAIYPIVPIQNIRKIDYLNKSVFRNCDIFVHQAIRDNNRYGKEYASSQLIAKLKKGCRVIAIPNIYHLPMCFFPQYKEEKQLRWKAETYFFRDSIIDNGLRQGVSFKKIDQIYHFQDALSETGFNFHEEFLHFIDEVRMREKDWDIPVSDFIIQNYRNHQLFYDPNHPTEFFLKYVASELTSILCNRECGEGEETIDDINVRALDTYEMPVMEAVKEQGKLLYKNSVIRNTGKKVVCKKMDVREYIVQYTSLIWTSHDYKRVLRIKSFILWVLLQIRDIFSLFGSAVNKCRK